MGIWKYRKPEPSDVRGLCVICQIKPQKKAQNRYRAICSYCYKKEHGKGDVKSQKKRHALKVLRPYRQHLKSICEKCGFVPVKFCQLDIHHIDGDHKNNDIKNLQTLCSNCHRLEHFE